MPRRADRPPLDLNRPLVTRREFVADGRPFGRGQPFDWRKLDIERIALRRLYDAGHVVHPDYEPSRVPEPTEPSPPPGGESSPVQPADGGGEGPVASPEQPAAPEPSAQEAATSAPVGRPVEELNINDLRKVARENNLPTRRSLDEQLAELKGAGITHAEV